MGRYLTVGVAIILGVAEAHTYGTLPSTPDHAASNYAAGLRGATLPAYWDRLQHDAGAALDGQQVAVLQQQLANLSSRGDVLINLDPGMQYPPPWVFALNNYTRFVNQFNVAYIGNGPAMDVPDAVFNAAVRAAQTSYLQKLITAIAPGCLQPGVPGYDSVSASCPIFAIRCGFGWFGELNYPPFAYGSSRNCYWGYGALAQGRVSGLLPPGVPPCPVPGWVPGQPSPNGEAAAFAGWYLDALRDWHDWQLASTRAFFTGALIMMYPSWGVRPGQLAGAVAGNLDGSTSVEINGELQRGFDFPRYIRQVLAAYAPVIVYTTWMDADAGNDSSSDPAQWSPPHWLAVLAAAAGGPDSSLRVWGENTGSNDVLAMQRCFARVQAYGLMGLMWAFEDQLYENATSGYATIEQYAALVASNP